MNVNCMYMYYKFDEPYIAVGDNDHTDFNTFKQYSEYMFG